MLTLHVVDHVMKDARAARLAAEVIERLPGDFAVTLVSSGPALERMLALGNGLARPVALQEGLTLGHRFAVAYKNEAQYSGEPTRELLADSFAAADVLWLPSLHHHLFDSRLGGKVVASFHDTAPVEMAEFIADKSDPAGSATATGMAALADLTTRRLVKSSGRLVTASQRAADWVAGYYGAPQRPIAVATLPAPDLLRAEFAPVSGLPVGYIACAAPIDPLSNHDVLLLAQARLKQSGGALPLVLAGEGTDRLESGGFHRADYLKALIEHLGLAMGQDVIGLGALAPGALKTVLAGAAGSVAPALAEGEALFAAGQAAELGAPVILSDLAAMREYAARRAFEPAWVKPGSADEFAAALRRLPETARRAPASLPDADWDDVACRYAALFYEQAGKGAA